MAEHRSSSHGDYRRSPPGPPPQKRRFDDPPVPEYTSRRPSNFSSSPSTNTSTTTSDSRNYRSVPPPMPDFELAKQKAEQIAARLVGHEFKRSRVSDDIDNGDRVSNYAPPATDFYSAQVQVRKMDVPNQKVGLVIGKGGETIRTLQQQSGAKIQVTRDNDIDAHAPTRQVELCGSAEQIAKAEQLIREVIGDALGGGGGGGGSGPSSHVNGEQLQIRVPNNKVGLIIGKGGETIKTLQANSGARIQVQHDRETEAGATERIVTLTGSKEETDKAQEMIKDVIGEGRRGYGGAGGGYQQNYRGGSQSWGQGGYNYQQGYGNQQQYGGYWDQNAQGQGYEYYQNQSTDGTQQSGEAGYNYQGYYAGYDQQTYDQQYAGYEQGGYGEQPAYEYDQAAYEQQYGQAQPAAEGEYAGYEYDQQYSYDQAAPAPPPGEEDVSPPSPPSAPPAASPPAPAADVAADATTTAAKS